MITAQARLCRPVLEVSSRLLPLSNYSFWPLPGDSFQAFRRDFIPTPHELSREAQNLLESCWKWVRDAGQSRVN